MNLLDFLISLYACTKIFVRKIKVFDAENFIVAMMY